MNKEVCNCIKLDMHGETDCKEASCDLSGFGFVCEHKCVVELTKSLQIEKNARISAEEKLEIYRRAIRPFVGICRDAVSTCDKQEGDGNGNK